MSSGSVENNNILKTVDDFIASILVLFDNIKIPAVDPKKTINILPTTIEKLYLTYYVYRIWIKYRVSIEQAVGKGEFKHILELLSIPNKYTSVYISYPMTNKMSVNEKQLDLILFQMLQQFHKSAEIYSKQPGGTGNYKQYSTLVEYLLGKSLENIIQDILQIKMLLPNLAKPSEDFISWDKILPFAATYESAAAEPGADGFPASATEPGADGFPVDGIQPPGTVPVDGFPTDGDRPPGKVPALAANQTQQP